MITTNNISCYLNVGRSEQLMDSGYQKCHFSDSGPATLTAVTSRACWHFFLWALFLLVWRLFPAKCRDCPSILLLDKEKCSLGEVNWQPQWVIIVYDVQFKSQIFQQFMDVIMHLICTVISDWCITLANCKFSWANTGLEEPQMFPGVFFQGMMPHLT